MSDDPMPPEHVRARIEASIERMSPLSPSATKVLSLVNDIDASPWELLQVIKMDPVLTGRVLRLVNSAHFGLNEPILSLNRALVILGLNTVKNLALSSSMIELLTSQTGEDNESARLWNHSLWVGVAARSIARARQLSREEQELAFIGGLLHDLGEVCILKVFPKEFQELRVQVEHGVDQLAAETLVFGASHAEFGGQLARKWRFPPELVVSLETHHNPILEGALAELSCTTYIANFFARVNEGVAPTDEDVWHPAALAVLNLDEHTVAEAMESVEPEVEAARVFLETP